MTAILIMGSMALVLAIIAWRRSPTLLRGAFRNAFLRFVEVLPRIAFACNHPCLPAPYKRFHVPPTVVPRQRQRHFRFDQVGSVFIRH